MITFKAIIIPNNKRSDGTYPVKIRVYYNGKNRRIPTTLVCKQTDLTKGSLKIKNQDILSKAELIIIEMRKAVRNISPFELEGKDVDYVVGRINEILKGNSFELDFFQWADSYIVTKSESTRPTYVQTLNAFERFLGKREIDINAITKTLLIEFTKFVEASPKMHYSTNLNRSVETAIKKVPQNASSRHLLRLSHIFQAAKDRYNDEDTDVILIPKSPFSHVPKALSAPTSGQTSIGLELMQKVISAETEEPLVRMSLDLFILSFGLMGANLADLYNATPVKDDVWIYNRQKTRTRRADKAEMKVTIPPEMKPFIERLTDGRGKKWWLSKLHFNPKKDYISARVNMGLRKWCKDNDIPPFTFYAARHTWASLARKVGVDKSTIDECLCHVGDFRMTDIYAERDWELINNANRKVIELFSWE